MTKKPAPPAAIRQLAEQIAADLFTVGEDGPKADSLKLFKGTRNLGGWSEVPMADRIETHLRNVAVTPKEKGK